MAADDLGAGAVYHRVQGYVSRWYKGDVLILGPGEIHLRLGGAAALLWTVLDRRTPLGEMGGRMAGWLGPDVRPVAAEEVRAALTVLIDNGLVAAAAGEPGLGG